MNPSSRPVGDPSRCRYLTYPHANGFAGGGRFLVLGERAGERNAMWRVNLATGDEHLLGGFPVDPHWPDPSLWFDIARDTGRLAAVCHNEVWLFDALGAEPPALLYRETDPAKRVGTLCSITADGRRVLIGRQTVGGYEIVELDVAEGPPRVLFAKPWFVNHAHYCPGDESWIGFCHEGPAGDVHDRVWAWHGEKAPHGVPLMDQREAGLWLGHERWAHDTASAFVVAYGDGPGERRGIYQLFPDGGVPRLVSRGDRDWHVNVSPDGSLAVVDTTGPHDLAGRGWQNAGTISDVLLVDTATGAREFLARTHRGPLHPFHPHPVFSPDGRTVFYNDIAECGTRGGVAAVALDR